MTFSANIYENLRSGVKKSAAAVAPRVDEIFKPKTVVDVGGGEGWWAAEFANEERRPLVIDRETPEVAAPGTLRLGLRFPEDYEVVERFDLALCLEFAEHIYDFSARALVWKLKELAEVVVFSAAIPGQGGHGHLNEQWPQYWAALFASYGEREYVASDDLRYEFWNDPEVEPWYRQNLLVFAPAATLEFYGLTWTNRPLPLVHPEIYAWRLNEVAELRKP